MGDASDFADSLTNRVATSAIWMTANSLVTKVVNFVGQLVLAWLLLPEQFGLISLAMTVTTLGDVINQFGLGDVVVTRAKRLHLWATAAFSLSLVVGLVSTIFMLGLSPIAGLVYNDATVGYLVAIMALATPFHAIGIVPLARLRAELRFKEIASLQAAGVILSMAVTIVCAASGMGAYSFAIGRIVSVPFVQIALFKRAKLNLQLKLMSRRWKYLFADSTYALFTSIFNKVIMQGDYIILGMVVTKAAVGQYFMAFTLSVQAIGLIANNLAMVIFPSLSSLADDPQRQIAVYIRGSRLIAAVAIPLCFWQASAADPLVRLVLSEKWYDVIPLVQVLSLGMAWRSAGWMWYASLKAQRRYAVGAQWSLLASFLFVICVLIAAVSFGVMGTALAVALFYTLVNPIQVWLAICPAKQGRVAAISNIFIRPTVIAALALGLLVLADFAFIGPHHTLGWRGDILRLSLITCVGLSLTLLFSLIGNRQTTLDLTTQIRPFIKLRRNRTSR